MRERKNLKIGLLLSRVLCLMMSQQGFFMSVSQCHIQEKLYGVIKEEAAFEGGVRHGATIKWHEDGSREVQVSYLLGEKNGVAISWYPGGVFKRSQVTFQQGRKIGKDVEWYKNGALKRDTPYQNGVPHGRSLVWYENGDKKCVLYWDGGEQVGDQFEWYQYTGQLKMKRSYVGGSVHGAETWWYESGEKSWLCQWNNGLKEGLLQEWYENGNKMSEVMFVNGVQEGKAIGWYENGYKSFESTYFQGREIALVEWSPEGVPAPAVPLGRIRIWAKAEIEEFYRGRQVQVIVSAFGEPDIMKDEVWVYRGLMVGGEFSKLEVRHNGDKVDNIQVMVDGE